MKNILKFLAVKPDTIMIGISEDDFCNEEITKEIYEKSPVELSICPVNEHINKAAILSDGFLILFWDI